jgi:hypothetical protein
MGDSTRAGTSLGSGMIERRRGERRNGDRRATPGTTLDVSRLEHENLCHQVDEILRSIRRMETELYGMNERLRHVESNLQSIVRGQSA